VLSDVSRRTGAPSRHRVTATSVLTAAGVRTARPVQVNGTGVIAGGTSPAVTAVALSVQRTARCVLLTTARLTAVDAVFARLTSCKYTPLFYGLSTSTAVTDYLQPVMLLKRRKRKRRRRMFFPPTYEQILNYTLTLQWKATGKAAAIIAPIQFLLLLRLLTIRCLTLLMGNRKGIRMSVKIPLQKFRKVLHWRPFGGPCLS